MRIICQDWRTFRGTHKGATLEIEREPDGRFYIIVTDRDGSYRYDGWAPESVRTMREAKAEALRGACL